MTEVLGITKTTLDPDKGDDRVYYCDECDTEFNIEVFKEWDRCPYCKAPISDDGVKGGS